MKGRWTLMGCPLGRITVTDGPSSLGIGEETPVVPCDDAAVERGARQVAVQWPGMADDVAKAVAARVLRAAGETR